ncbi:integrase core domain-containing protein [Amphritea atlantica]|uniref:integrase core domain-containing protein n=1 Tax=Amphritea atlantica TaxID=355243 RepID=UPI003CCBDE21
MREWSYGKLYNNSAQRNAKLPCYLKRYNLVRPHGSLNKQPPISRLLVNNVSEIYS